VLIYSGMLKIRLQRVGRKHEPAFRLVLTDSKNSSKSGRFKEVLGSYDPRKSVDAFKADRIKHWLSMGAGLTGSVNNLLIRHNIIRGKKTHVGADFVVKEVPVVETPAPEEAPVETPTEAPAVEEAAPAPAEEVSVPEPEASTSNTEEAAPAENPAPEEPAA
jgi:small subunit ribosomal protein S16